MNRKVKILLMYSLILVAMLVFSSKVQAASASISASKTSVTIGESVGITVSVHGASWNLNMSGAVTNGYADVTDDAENTSKTYTASFTPSSAGTYTISLTGTVTDSDLTTKATINESITINASNSTGENPNSGNGTATSSGGTTTTVPGTQTPSNVAYLSNLGITPNDFTGFKPGTLSYNVTVPAEVETISIYATAQSNGKVSGTGTKILKEGNNTFSVIVTSEDGTAKKTYTLNITREETKKEEQEAEENTENVQEQYTGDGLATLKIGNLKLSPEFDTIIYEYTVKYIGEETKLEVETTTTDPYYTVEITGNEDLKEGENIITILVSDPDGNNVATYQVTVNKSLVDEEALAKEQEEARKKEEQKKLFIMGGAGVVLVVIAIIVFLIVRNRRKKAWAEEYSVPFSGLGDDENYQEEFENYDEDEIDLPENQEEDRNDDVEEIEQLSKEEVREKFLDNYHSEDEFYQTEEIEEPRKRRHKGKRFK